MSPADSHSQAAVLFADSDAQNVGGRLARVGAVHILLGWVVTLIAPVWVLLLAPLVLGVPHVLNDLRLFVWQPAMPVARRLLTLVLVPLAVLTALRVALLLGAPRFPLAEVLLGFTAVAGAAWEVMHARYAFPSRSTKMAEALSLALLFSFGLSCALRPTLCAVLLAHAHNLIAVGIWIAFLRRGKVSRAARFSLGALYLALLAALLLFAIPQWLTVPVAGFGLEGLRDSLAPGLAHEVGDRLVLSFAYAQLMHYSVWVFLLPACAWGVRRNTRVRERFDNLQRSFGVGGLALVAVVLLTLPLLGLFDPVGARSAYLTFVLFHGWLEIALITYWLGTRDTKRTLQP